jgi:hypothetical protein
MPQDHYVAQTYLGAFIDPKTNHLHAYSKRGSGYFEPTTASVCKTMNWDQTPKFLSPRDALGRWLEIFEPPWAAVVAKLETSHVLAPNDKDVLAGYWAYCLPVPPRGCVPPPTSSNTSWTRSTLRDSSRMPRTISANSPMPPITYRS